MSKSKEHKRKVEFLQSDRSQDNKSFPEGETEKTLQEDLLRVSLNEAKQDPLNQEREITGPESLIDGDIVVDGSVGVMDVKRINNELYVVITDQEGHDHYRKFEVVKEAIGRISQFDQDKI